MKGLIMWLLCVFVAMSLASISTANEICSGTCPKLETCCKQPTGLEGCCPFSNATCCEDGLHCCPHGMQCDLKQGKCNRGEAAFSLGLIDTSLPDPTTMNTSAITVLDNEFCLDGSECPDQSTCCPLGSGRYGCCPRPNAVCCSDQLHCCPEDYRCDGAGYCHPLEPLVNMVFLDREREVDDIPCRAGDMICAHDETCCPLIDGTWSCCPMESAVCCSDGQHCCPLGYECLPGSQECLKV